MKGCDGTECDKLLSTVVVGSSGSGPLGSKGTRGRSKSGAGTLSSTIKDDHDDDGQRLSGTDDAANLRETHSCPSSPTETDCSSGFSTLRRRSVTLTEKVTVMKFF